MESKARLRGTIHVHVHVHVCTCRCWCMYNVHVRDGANLLALKYSFICQLTFNLKFQLKLCVKIQAMQVPKHWIMIENSFIFKHLYVYMYMYVCLCVHVY